jgi:hypothetical protein
MKHLYDRERDKLVDDEGTKREDLPRYEVIGVWGDGVLHVLKSRLTYAEAVQEYERLVRKRGGRVPPFYGISDPDDPERGYGPWRSD